MITIETLTPGESYACRFRVETMLDTLGRPAPNLSDVPVKGAGIYESIGVIKTRDVEQQLVLVQDTQSKRDFVVAWSDCWDVDTVDWRDQ